MARTHRTSPTVARMLLGATLLAPAACADFRELDEQTDVELSSQVDDWRDEVIYQVLVDRFENGDRGNDFNVNFDDLARYQGGDWQGLIDRMGYFQELGVTTLWISPVIRNVDTDANVDGYHGYWAQDFEDVNPHFGSLATLQELVREAHRRDMKVIIDIVTNHVGQAFFYDMNLNGVADINIQNDGNEVPVNHYTEYDPDFDPRGIQAFTSLGEAGPAPVIFQWDPATNHVPPQPALFSDPAVYNRKGRTTNFDDPLQLINGDFPGGLKDIDTTRCDVKQEMVEIYAGWIEKTNADGYRIDTIKHVEYEFWRYFTQRLRQRLAQQGKSNFLMFGEVFDGRDDLLGSFTKHDIYGNEDLVRFLGQEPAFTDPTDEEQLAAEQACDPGGPPLTGDQIDSVFYFSQHFQAVRDVFASAQGTRRIQTLWESRSDTWGTEPNELGIGISPARLPINFVDNHDVARFLFNLRDRDQDTRIQLLHNVLLFINTVQGIPCLYYGTEQAFEGGNDPANRERMWDTGFDTTGPTFQWTKRVLALRRAYPALRRGETLVTWSTEHTGEEPDAGIFAFERFGADSGGSYVLMVFNTHQGHPSTPAFDGQTMTVSAPAGTVLVDAIANDGVEYVVGADQTVDITVDPMRGAMLVPASELRPGI
ncbi:MAG: alpha-amylase family glycosyl hydrolase [Nannocystaceae bacterium]